MSIHVSSHISTQMSKHTSTDMCADMCADKCVDRRTDMCAYVVYRPVSRHVVLTCAKQKALMSDVCVGHLYRNEKERKKDICIEICVGICPDRRMSRWREMLVGRMKDGWMNTSNIFFFNIFMDMRYGKECRHDHRDMIIET